MRDSLFIDSACGAGTLGIYARWSGDQEILRTRLGLSVLCQIFKRNSVGRVANWVNVLVASSGSGGLSWAGELDGDGPPGG